MNVLISGAGVAGPTLAYWLRRYGYAPTVVERAPAMRMGLGGHAVDLFGPAVDVVDRMGLLPQVRDARTRLDVVSLERPGKPPVEVDFRRLIAGVSSKHVEIMRGELVSILYEATRHDVEYVFGDSVRTLDPDGDAVAVTFEHAAPRRFDLVVGADGLHSTVRALAFGDDARFLHYIGGYLAVFTLPNYLGLDGRTVGYQAVDRVVGMYPVRQNDRSGPRGFALRPRPVAGEARALLLFRRAEPLAYDHRDAQAQKRLLQEEFAGFGWQVPRLLAEAERATDLYFDSISQVVMDTWSKGRITLVGDAGYSPGPAVGGGTSVAVVGAHVLAGELFAAGGDHTTALRAYEDELREFVRGARRIGPTFMKSFIPRSERQIRFTTQLMRVVPRLPAPVQRMLFAWQRGPARTLESITVRRYEP